MKKKRETLSVDELQLLYNERRKAIRERLKDFANVPGTEYFYELVYCLMTPQSTAVNAGKAVAVLKEQDFEHIDIDPESFLHQKEFYIRFHKTKAKHLIASKEMFHIIFSHLTNGSTSTELREWLVKNVKGLGWKEASHFLRNIGHRNLAILDRHILRNLVRVGVLHRLPKTLTVKKYLLIEKKFLIFSQQTGISMDELDLLFWSMETGKILK
jgi:N-glycosylase/DNA lyase